ncbi:hypothetical protein SCH4B_0112 [Ruegeria sp. TrichCH4B]|nr:hypothetical protein SCH4B_0112 [Ruegeria sp. TrichCH4B]
MSKTMEDSIKRWTERADTRIGHKPARSFVPVCDVLNLGRDAVDPFFRTEKVLQQLAQNNPCSIGQIVLKIIDRADDIELEYPGALAKRDAVFQAIRPHLTYEIGLSFHQPAANTMQHLQIDLMRLLYPDEPHRRSGRSFRDRLGIDNVVLVRLHVELDELSRDDAAIMADSRSFLASHCEPGQASMPTRVGSACVKNCVAS